MGNYARVYLYAGIVFVSAGIATDSIAIFLPIGIALIVVGMLVIRRSHTRRTNMIACCGLDCFKCEGFLATQADDDSQRAEVAKQWSARYGSDIKPEQINCDGCCSDDSASMMSHMYRPLGLVYGSRPRVSTSCDRPFSCISADPWASVIFVARSTSNWHSRRDRWC